MLADDTGTAEEYNQLFLQLQALQNDAVSGSEKTTRRKKKTIRIWNIYVLVYALHEPDKSVQTYCLSFHGHFLKKL